MLKTQELYAFSLDPILALKPKVWRTGRPLDPAWTLVSTLVVDLLSRARTVASPFQKPDPNMLLGRDFKLGKSTGRRLIDSRPQQPGSGERDEQKLNVGR